MRNDRSSVASASAAVNLYGAWSGEDGATIAHSSRVWANSDAKGVGLGFTGDI